MAITEITIENFKGIGKKQTIPIRPITLLFGGNSAGKSTILQAIHLFKEILSSGLSDVDSLIPGVPSVNIGGFRNYVHNKDLKNTVSIGLTIDVDDDGLPNYLPPTPHLVIEDDPCVFAIPETDFSLNSISIEISISWDMPRSRSYVSQLKISLDKEHFCTLSKSATDIHPSLTALKPFLPNFMELVDEQDNFNDVSPDALWNFAEEFIKEDANLSDDERFAIPERPPTVLPLALTLYDKQIIPLKFESILKDENGENIEESDFGQFADWILTRCISGGLELLRNELIGTRYIGSLRTIPERGYQGQSTISADRWASGLAAWDLLSRATSKTGWLDMDRINALGMGCELKEVTNTTLAAHDYKKLRSLRNKLVHGNDLPPLDQQMLIDLADQAILNHKLSLTTGPESIALEACDVGVGVSQVIPVAIGVQETNYSIIMVEQPELHIHPRVQCELADLLIHQINKSPSKVQLLETHSEHIILRMLRRIKETTRGKLQEGIKPIKPEAVAVLYIEPGENGSTIKELRIDNHGRFKDEWPQGFFEERFDELF